ncbi:FtsX-like permease family protein [Helicobacter cetorum]|uniref:Cell division protein FtsX n=1 Tax=Helicobacter cetorum (strain ATCC BAA-540 / CCUG 52418 / MIT 99-5656) TaxID=1163745 RepID=I0ETV2_HELCM|nr:FtsX-like permease family protein [Helicobacter cetorum]AFI06371.1 cell division protein FtsX [Helicobacter cetorum MIT 99-5656]
MNTLKKHLAFIIPLVALLFGLECVLLINGAIAQKEKKLIEDYSVVLASTQKLELELLRQNFSEVVALKDIDPNYSLEPLKKTLGTDGLKELKKNLPFFYSLQFSTFPSQERLENIKEKLLKIPGIQKVEVFAKTHMQVYELLSFIKVAVYVFALVVLVLSLLLMFKQIRLWIYQYHEQLEIMDLLGASVSFRNAFLYKMVFTDSLIASCLTPILMLYLTSQKSFEKTMDTLGIIGGAFVLDNFLWGLLLSLVVSFVSVLLVAWRTRYV